MHFNRKKGSTSTGSRRGCIWAGAGEGAFLYEGPRGGVGGSSLVIIHSHIMNPGTGLRMGMNHILFKFLNNAYRNTNGY